MVNIYNTREYHFLYNVLENADWSNNTVKKYKDILDEVEESRPEKLLNFIMATIGKIRSAPKWLRKSVIRVSLSAIILNTALLNDFKSLVKELDNEIYAEVLTQEEIWIKTFGWELKNPLEMVISEAGKDSIKDIEKLRLIAYDIKDGKITVGYGHAEPKKKSKFKVGQKITKEEADILFDLDIAVFQEGVHRLFRQWQEQDINIRLTQAQFDVLVSMAFNMGVGGLRGSEFIQLVKKNKLDEAGNLIPYTGIRGKFRNGLENRREREAMFFFNPS